MPDPAPPQPVPPEPAPRQPIPPQRIPRKPSRWWYALALALVVVSVAIFFGCLSWTRAGIAKQVASMQRFVAPGSAEVHIDEPGLVTVFYENHGTLDGRAYDTPRRQVWPVHGDPSMSCSVAGPGGEPVEAGAVDMVEVYQTAGREGHAMWRLRAKEAGVYRVSVRYKPKHMLEENRPVLMAVGGLPQAWLHAGWTPMYAGATAVAFGGTAAVVIVLVVFFARLPRSAAEPEPVTPQADDARLSGGRG